MGWRTTPSGSIRGWAHRFRPNQSRRGRTTLVSARQVRAPCQLRAYLIGPRLSQDPGAGTNVAPASAVDLVVSSGAPTIGIIAPGNTNPPSLTFSAVEGDSNPPTQWICIANTGTGTLSWIATDDATWLSLNLTAFATPAGDLNCTIVSVDTTGVASGTHTSTVTVTAAGATNSPQTVSVTLTVSAGPPPVPVPAVVGLTQTAAAATIADASLTVGTVTTTASAEPATQVLSHTPPAGTNVLPGSAIELAVSTGPVAMPDVTGLLRAEAEAALTAAGLVVGSETTTASAEPATQVLAQSPVARTNVAPGSSVDLSVSTGPVVVPDVTGLLQTDADGAFTAAGLVLGTVTTTASTEPATQVLTQTPAGGTDVAPGSPVEISVSTGPVAVPDLTGLLQADAEAALMALGLAVGTVTTATSVTVPVGTVLSQNPAAGTSVAPGNPVSLVVSAGS